jgi:hypothetical protein
MAFTAFNPYVLRYLKKEKPDLIFSTHYFNTMAVSHVRRAYGLQPLLVNFLSEVFDFDSYWYLKNVDHYVVNDCIDLLESSRYCLDNFLLLFWSSSFPHLNNNYRHYVTSIFE